MPSCGPDHNARKKCYGCNTMVCSHCHNDHKPDCPDKI